MKPDYYTSIDTATCQFEYIGSRAGQYEAAVGSDFQVVNRPNLRDEEGILPQRHRDRVESANLDLQRNSAIAGWTVRKHLDFVATHNFDCTSGDKTLDDDIEGVVAEWSEPGEFDIRNRFGLHDHIRLDEAGRTVRGDMLVQKIANGRVQAIEADRIRNPPKENRRNVSWKNGTLQNDAGRITHYAVHKRNENGYEFERILKAEEVYHFGYYMRHDQRRGISQMVSALNHLRQAHNSIKYAQAKQVISQIFGLKVKREKPNFGKIDLQNGPFVAEVGVTEDIELMSDKTPSTEFDNFLRHVISIVMKSLDLPYNFYDESHTNFFGSRAALNLYLMSCLAKRRGVRALLSHLTPWRLNYEVGRGNLRLPRSMDVKQIYRKHCEWIPIGVQWWNPKQEADAAEKLIALRLASRSELRKQTNGDSWSSLMDKIEAEEIRIGNNAFSETTGSGDSQNNDSMIDQIIEGVVMKIQEMGLAA